MKIAFVSTMEGSPWGGSEELWSQAALRLQEQGYHVAASVKWWPQPARKLLALKQHGIDVWERMALQQCSFMERVVRRVGRRLHCTEQEIRWLGAQKPDLVVISQGGNFDGFEWMNRCSETGIRYVTISHNNHEAWIPSDEVAERIVEGYRGAEKVYCVSHFGLNLLEEQICQKLPNGEVVWNPCNVEPGPPVHWPEDGETIHLAMVAELDANVKGHDTLMRVLAEPEWRRRPVVLNIYGRGKHRQFIERFAAYLGLDNVRLGGHVDGIRELWRSNHLLVMPSRNEGIPLALVEAMRCGRPAVAARVGGIAELLADNETGFIAETPAAEALSRALDRAWKARLRWPEMGHAAWERIEQVAPQDAVGEFCSKLRMSCKPGHAAGKGRD
ncbi:MAG: glycosyltransferase family 4 protein [Terracidiphilus sp.]|nr:glycosyltransferase family 4 protein [Terracidiphilus sp.]